MKPISQMVDDSLENALGSSLSMPPKIFPRQFQNDANEGDPAHDGVASDNFYNRRTQSNGEGYSAIHSMNGDSKNDHSPRNQPKEVLLSKLRHGFTVIKHGRHGAPHKRILTCDDRVTKLYWQSENDAKNKKVHSVNESEGKHINLADVTAVITGADLDPTVMNGMPGRKGSFESISSNITSSTMADKPRRKRRFTLSSSQDEIVYGTANLRRHCSPEDMPLCISLITPDR